MSSEERNALVILRDQLEKAKSELGRPGAKSRRNTDRIQKLDEAMVAVEVMIGQPKARRRTG